MKLSLLITIVLAVFFFSCSSDDGNTGETKDENNQKDDEAAADDEESDDAQPVCGNSAVETGETCDGGEKDCKTLDSTKWESGKAACKEDCSGYDETNCVEINLCGNETVDTGEECDTKDEIPCESIDVIYVSGTATCSDECKMDVTGCVKKCGNGTIDEGEDCEFKEGEETQETISCHKLSWLEYKSGDAVCKDDCKWDKTACVALDTVLPYGTLTNIGLNEAGTISDSKKLCVPKDDGSGDCEFDAQYALGAVRKDPLISGSYGNGKSFLKSPNIFSGKTGGKYSLAVNKGFDPLPEKFFTLYASIAYTPITFDNIEMFGPQIVLMFNSETIPNTAPGVNDYYNIGGIGDDDIIIAIGEQFVSSDTIDVDSLCIAAIAFGKKMEVTNAFNVMQDGGGGSISFSGFDIPLYHPTETPIGDLTEMVKSYGLENICAKE